MRSGCQVNKGTSLIKNKSWIFIPMFSNKVPVRIINVFSTTTFAQCFWISVIFSRINMALSRTLFNLKFPLNRVHLPLALNETIKSTDQHSFYSTVAAALHRCSILVVVRCIYCLHIATLALPLNTIDWCYRITLFTLSATSA